MARIVLRIEDNNVLRILKFNEDDSVDAVKSLTFERISEGKDTAFTLPKTLDQNFEVVYRTNKGEANG